MAIKYINLGTGAGAGNGDTLRTAFAKINDNFKYFDSLLLQLNSEGDTSEHLPKNIGDGDGDLDDVIDLVGTLFSNNTGSSGIISNYNSATQSISLSLSPATTSTLGGIKIGSGLSINNNNAVSVFQQNTGPQNNNIKHFDFIESIEWVVQHNMNTRFFVERITDSQGQQIFAKVTVIDNNSFVIKLTEAISGSVDVMFNSIL